MEGLFVELTVWHWLGLALLLLAFEMMVGTFDLLWIAIAAGAAALFASIAPESISGWPYQASFFAVIAVILIVAGRTVFSGKRTIVDSHPTLNDRNASLVGVRAIVSREFSGGVGRVKINDSEWQARVEDAINLSIGDPVVVISASGTTVIVKAV